ncbi:DUF1799 domain-containing protein [Roseibium sp. CAU 1637]|uniref:DUF1799 domain-containing protein n=1 Tax=Roseibium limicola TaxID=2816037 RepID=A0A939ENK6_9HYPH|nr:DUF1799 domain-containing protein [Roseibium limicola]MBO0346045.1 DUF1799 domain-containing protein [Roseibium limicola]
MAAARAWAFARRGLIDPEQSQSLDQDTASDFEALGVAVPAAEISEPEAFDVWRCNWRSVTAFLSLETQWRVAAGPAGFAFLGLDYTAAKSAFSGRSRRAWQNLLADLQIMERAALPILNGEPA